MYVHLFTLMHKYVCMYNFKFKSMYANDSDSIDNALKL